LTEEVAGLPDADGERAIKNFYMEVFDMMNDDGNQKNNPMNLPNIPTYNLNGLPIQMPSNSSVMNFFRAMRQNSINEVWRSNCETIELLSKFGQKMAEAQVAPYLTRLEFDHKVKMYQIEEERGWQENRGIAANSDTAVSQSKIEDYKVREAIGFDDSGNFDFQALDEKTRAAIRAVIIAMGKK